MKERSILLSDEAIHATLDNRKTMARWVVKVPEIVERINGKPHWCPKNILMQMNFSL
jgi:hypothetical protein